MLVTLLMDNPGSATGLPACTIAYAANTISSLSRHAVRRPLTPNEEIRTHC